MCCVIRTSADRADISGCAATVTPPTGCDAALTATTSAPNRLPPRPLLLLPLLTVASGRCVALGVVHRRSARCAASAAAAMCASAIAPLVLLLRVVLLLPAGSPGAVVTAEPLVLVPRPKRDGVDVPDSRPTDCVPANKLGWLLGLRRSSRERVMESERGVKRGATLFPLGLLVPLLTGAVDTLTNRG